jgi:hypothetical protein
LTPSGMYFRSSALARSSPCSRFERVALTFSST